jgi:hypothetical protein
MGWDHIERQKRLAPIGEYRPEVYRVTVHAFQQLYLGAAAQAIRSGMSVSEFLNYAADYVLRHHRELKRVRAVFRKGARKILSAVRTANPATDSDPDTERERRRRKALRRFQEWAGPELTRREGER